MAVLCGYAAQAVQKTHLGFFIGSLYVRVFYGFYVWVRGVALFYACVLPVLRVCFMPFVLCVRLCVRFGMGFMRVLRFMLLSVCFMGVLSCFIRACMVLYRVLCMFYKCFMNVLLFFIYIYILFTIKYIYI